MLAGVRRVGADRHDQRQHGGEGRRAQHQPAGLRGHRPHQGARRAGLLRRRLLRGHSRLRRQGQRRAGRRERVPGPGGAAGRRRVARVGHEREPAAADGQRCAADADLRHQGPDAEGHGRPLRRAHHRVLALQLLQQPAVAVGHHGGAGPDHGPGLRGAAGAAVPAGRGPAGAHGLRLPQRLRRGLLQGRHGQPRPALLGPGAAQRQEHRRAGRHLRQRRGHVPERLRRRHGEDGLRRRAHRQQRQDQGQLQGRLTGRFGP
ncbi:uncharacterized protein LOC112875560 isoform X2 [Panicum hallii]|uniref:uncharacterized protein LOC112875560 isoform X2 n=1 Tax=Panicum hallii TaxID=206008 RepID=UPI000DF4CB20|nr:uncharacterized protein LOC112875560 isoform X2 [Panicum hallii]